MFLNSYGRENGFAY